MIRQVAAAHIRQLCKVFQLPKAAACQWADAAGSGYRRDASSRVRPGPTPSLAVWRPEVRSRIDEDRQSHSHVQGLTLGKVQADEHPHVARRATSRRGLPVQRALGRPGLSRLAEPLASAAQVTYSMKPAKHGPARLVSVSR